MNAKVTIRELRTHTTASWTLSKLIPNPSNMEPIKSVKAEEHPLSQKPLFPEGKTHWDNVLKRYVNDEPVVDFLKTEKGDFTVTLYEEPIAICDTVEDAARLKNFFAVLSVRIDDFGAELLKAEQELENLTILHDKVWKSQAAKIQELEETISGQKNVIALREKQIKDLKEELKNDRNPSVDINYDLHEGRGEGNELL